MKTELNHWFGMINKGDTFPTYTRDSWEIPESGAEIWCSAWNRGQKIKPYGDGCHVVVGIHVFHCDELMEILMRNEENGERWGIEGVKPTREQRINGRWVSVDLREEK